MTNTNAQQRNGLDALRGIGITGIFFYHLCPSFVPGGFLGVPLFFVLSGYFMFLTSERSWNNHTFHIGRYYQKRFLKIYPPLITMVLLVCCYMTLSNNQRMIGIRSEIASIFLGCNNWWQIAQHASYFSRLSNMSCFTHLWFLSLEIQFYLLWPFLFLLYKKMEHRHIFSANQYHTSRFGFHKMREKQHYCENDFSVDHKESCTPIAESSKLYYVFFVLAVLSFCRMLFLYMPGKDPSRVYYGTDTMAFCILIGIFTAAYQTHHTSRSIQNNAPAQNANVLPKQDDSTTYHFPKFSLKKLYGILASAVLLISILFMTVHGTMPFLYQGGMFLLCLFYGTLILLVNRYKAWLASRPIVVAFAWLGRHSYEIYLWHYPIIVLGLSYFAG